MVTFGGFVRLHHLPLPTSCPWSSLVIVSVCPFLSLAVPVPYYRIHACVAAMGYIGAVRRRVVVYKLGYEPPEEDIQLDAQVGDTAPSWLLLFDSYILGYIIYTLYILCILIYIDHINII